MTSAVPLPRRRPSSAKATSLRDALAGIGVLLLVLALVEIAVPSVSRGIGASVLDGLVVATFTVTGLVAWYRRPHNSTGRLMVATALAACLSSMQDDEVVAMRAVGVLVSSVPLALLLHLLLGFPSGRLRSRAAWATVLAGYAVALLPQPLKMARPDIENTVWTIQAVAGLVTLVAAFVLATRRLSSMPPVLRRQLLPFVGYGCGAIAVIAGTVVVIHVSSRAGVDAVADAVQLVMLCGLPLAFVVGLTAGAFGRAGEVEEVAIGISDASAEPALLDDLMVRALGDPSARVLWRDPGLGLVDSDGATRDVPADRGVWAIGGEPSMGRLEYDRGLVDDPGLLDTVTAPLALAMDNRRLVVELRAAVQQLQVAAEQVRTSRRRIVVAADAERRRIARDLHDGAQQRVVLVGLEVQRLGRRASDAEFVRSTVPHVTALCESLVDELRALVQGIMPSRLQDHGLEAAIAGLADELPVPVRVDVGDGLGRWGAEVESTGYFVVAEGLTNALKHAAATRIVVAAAVDDGRMRIRVTDDGSGPAGAVPGFGLRSLRDRVEALDGWLRLEPADGGGATLEAEFSCS